ncbi:primase C-terminal domain-containing protein, partial [Fructilactobacillus florum]
IYMAEKDNYENNWDGFLSQKAYQVDTNKYGKSSVKENFEFKGQKYHVVYVLNEPAFVSKKGSRYPVLEVSKMISNNIKASIKNELGQVDVGCNNFGIFRIPRQDNVIYFQSEMTVKFSELLNWSKKFYQVHKPKLQVIKSNKTTYGKQVDQPWFDWLLHKTDIKPGMGIGRHNTVLTLALACYSSRMNENDCYDLLDQFNTNLKVSLNQRDVDRCIRDAYSGIYKGASSIYINELIETWASTSEQTKLKQVKSNSWYKFAKKREDRKYSHKSEWKQDLITFFNKVATNNENVVISTRKIQQNLGISPSSLSRALKSLKKENKLIIKDTGFNKKKAYTTLYTLVRQLQNKKEQYRIDVLKDITEENINELSQLEQQLKSLKQENKNTIIVDIGDLDTG